MKAIMKNRRKNPFRISFLSVAVICCVTLSVVFYYISYVNNKVTQQKHNQEKLELVMKDFESQLQMMEEVALRIVSDNEFHPYYFKENVVKEMSMLQTFKQYSYYIPLAEEYFLYYGDSWIYRSFGTVLDLNLFMKMKSKNEDEWLEFKRELSELKGNLSEITGEPKILSIFNEDLYILIPIRVRTEKKQDVAVLVLNVERSALEERFRVSSGGIAGRLTLYAEDEILYSNSEHPCVEGQKDVLTVVSQNKCYRFCYQPDKIKGTQGGLFFLHILLILMDIFLVFVIADVFAKKTYEPVQVLAESYRKKGEEKSSYHENALKEIEVIMDSMLQSNMEAQVRIQENQEMLRSQILQMIMSGRASFETLKYLDKVGISLPGPFYCVVSISFEEQNITSQFLTDLQDELGQVPDKTEKEYVYTVCNFEKKLLNVICSTYTEECKNELVETLCAVAESFSYEPIIGIGNVCQNLSDLSASWLESMDTVHNRNGRAGDQGSNGYIYDAEGLRRIMIALESGKENAALEKLQEFVERFGNASVSMLMLQYILADFLGMVREIEKKYKIEISKQNTSLLISARSVQDFEKAVKNIIHEICINYKNIRIRMEEGESKRIYEYINEHFSEYDISIEKVAENLHTNTEVVRQAILMHTGKLYRDYLIYLRIEYAKVLLQQEDISVAELCQKVGYGNVSHFIKLFREVTGVTPAKYRKGIVKQQ